MEKYGVSCKKNTANENSIVRKTKQNRLNLKTKNCTILIIFQMISLKWIKSLINF